MYVSREMLKAARESRNKFRADLRNRAEAAAGRVWTDAENRQFDADVETARELDAAVLEFEERIEMQDAAEGHQRDINPGGLGFTGTATTTGTHKGKADAVDVRGARWSVSSEPGIYQDPDLYAQTPSFFLDLRNAKLGDWEAADRLNRNHKVAVEREDRAGDMTTVAGAGGQFAPPLWLVEQFVALARPGRVAADLMTHDTLPTGISSINLPKVSSGATTAVQQTQNSALSDTAMTTTSVSSGITTIGGKQIVSLQLMEQSAVPFDRVILSDLAADYAKQLDTQVLYGTGSNGQLRGWVGASTNTAFTTASPALTSATAANSFYNKVIAASAGINTTRYLPPNAIVMHPNRWAWCLEALDSQVRPIISADGQSVNTAAISTNVVAQGSVGTLGKLPVYVDPNISLTANSATNQDECYVIRTDDLYLWESPLRLEAFEQTYADNASVLFRALAFSAAIPDRYSASLASIRGTGLIAPTL